MKMNDFRTFCGSSPASRISGGNGEYDILLMDDLSARKDREALDLMKDAG
jgi:hypothetical protein